jgi:SAM-dependent methyltransferase
MKWFYELLYRYFRAPWDIGPRPELVDLVKSGRLKPGRAIDLGSGTASNVIFLAQHGFEVTGVDFAAAAIDKGRRMALEAGVNATFIHDDLTTLQRVTGIFDLLVDYGTLDDLSPPQRDKVTRNILRLTRPGTQFLLYCFEWEPRWWERLLYRLSFFGAMQLDPGEAERRFGPYFDIEVIARHTNYKQWPAGYAVYLMNRKEG